MMWSIVGAVIFLTVAPLVLFAIGWVLKWVIWIAVAPIVLLMLAGQWLLGRLPPALGWLGAALIYYGCKCARRLWPAAKQSQVSR
jgi:hypothetical protein